MAKGKRKRAKSSLTFWLIAGGGGLLLLVIVGVTGGIFWQKYRARRAAQLAEMNRLDPDKPADVDNKAKPPVLPKGKEVENKSKGAQSAKANELDKQDPDWRIEAIITKSTNAKMDKNGADMVLELDAQLPKGWEQPIRVLLDHDSLSKTLTSHPAVAGQLRALLVQHKPAADMAQQLAQFPTGRFEMQITNNPYQTPIKAVEANKATQLLQALSMLHVLDNKSEDAVLAVWGMVNVGRYLKEDPVTISHIVRVVVQRRAMNRLEDALRYQSKKEPGDALLSGLQSLLLAEGSDPELLYTLRCERGLVNLVFERLQSREITLSELNGVAGLPLDLDRQPIDVPQSHRNYLEKMTRAVEGAKKPPHEQFKQFLAMGKPIVQPGDPLGVFMAVVPQLYEPYWYRCAKLRTAATGLALERYRRVHQQWPTGLSQLVPKFMPSVPLDPYDGQPLRFRSFPEGVAVYSIGFTFTDAAKTFQALENRQPAISNASFRLWHPQNRRAAP